MGKSKAEIQRAYRERKKLKEGENYLEKERQRVNAYYIPVAERSKKEQKSRREKVRKWVQSHRERKKTEKQASKNLADLYLSAEQSNEVTSSTDTTERPPLIVKIPFIDSKSRTRKRISRATAKSRREIKNLREENEKLQRKYKTVSKRYERLKKRTENNASVQQSPENRTRSNDEVQRSSTEKQTPKKRTYSELRAVGITPTKLPKTVKDNLVFANVLTDEIETAWKENNQMGKTAISRVLSGDKIKKYRLKTQLSMKTGIRRQMFLKKSKRCDNIPKRIRMMKERQKMRLDIKAFLEKDENSRIMPGKNDKMKTINGYAQKRVLNDTMSFLHLKYKLETSSNISFTTFTRMRPKHIMLTKYLSRNKCLCQKHQNMALALKSLKSAGAEVPINPDEFVRLLQTETPDSFFAQIKEAEINYAQWKKVELLDGKKRTKIVNTKIEKADFISKVREQICDFQEHVRKVKTQYQAINQLKENLPIGHAIVQMDFAENYTCSSADEVQSAYWNSSVVSLHPVVVYFRDPENLETLRHKNFVYVSDDLGHNIGHIYSILKSVVPEIKQMVPDLQWVHYWTDSPSSQYRNKTSFYIVSDHLNLLTVKATWNFFECGHGKGPCDGVGGTSKRTADQAIKQQKITVQDAREYFENVKKLHVSAEYRFISSQQIQVSRIELAEINKDLNPVRGTLQIHQVFAAEKGKVQTCITSCYCQDCLIGNAHDFTESVIWKPRTVRNRNMNVDITDRNDETEMDITEEEDITKRVNETEMNRKQKDFETMEMAERDCETEINTERNVETEMNMEITERNCGTDTKTDVDNQKEIDIITNEKMEVNKERQCISEDEWVAIYYESDWHIGHVIDIDDDDELEVKFLRPTTSLSERKDLFKWPTPPDILNVARPNIICKISEPLPVGRSGRSFQLKQADYDRILECFSNEFKPYEDLR